MEEKQYKSFQVTKSDSQNEGKELAIEGYASVFGNVDCYGDIVEKGAFAESLSKEGSRICLCFNHDTDKIIGRIDELKEDETGLFFKATILPTKLGKDMIILIEGGALKDLSFMYRVNDASWEKIDGKDIRHIKNASLYEISVVWRGANDKAKIENCNRKSSGELQQSITDLQDDELQSLRKSIADEQAIRIINKLNFK